MLTFINTQQAGLHDLGNLTAKLNHRGINLTRQAELLNLDIEDYLDKLINSVLTSEENVKLWSLLD